MIVGLEEGVGVDDICTMTMRVRVDNGEIMIRHYNKRGSNFSQGFKPPTSAT